MKEQRRKTIEANSEIKYASSQKRVNCNIFPKNIAVFLLRVARNIRSYRSGYTKLSFCQDKKDKKTDTTKKGNNNEYQKAKKEDWHWH